MEATLVIIGLNFRTAHVAVRERFWMNESRRTDALQQLVRTEGIDEILILTTCNRTEFVFWANDPAEAANSILRFLTREFNLKLAEWSNFYRLMDDNALLHLFRVACGLDSMALGEAETVTHITNAWALAQRAGSTGRILDAVIQKTMSVAKRARTESSLKGATVSLPVAAIQLIGSTFKTVQDQKIMLVGAGRMSEQAGCHLLSQGIKDITVVNRTLNSAEDLGRQLGAKVVPFEKRYEALKEADVVMSATSSLEPIFSAEGIGKVAAARAKRPLVFVDLGVPRNVAPQVRNLPNTLLYDIDDLERVMKETAPDRRSDCIKADQILQEELNGFRRKLMAENLVPTIVALREHLEEICGQELRSLEDQYGPFTEDQQSTLHSLASHITQRIASTMARELKGLPEKADQQLLTEAVQRLFHLQPAKAPVPATKN